MMQVFDLEKCSFSKTYLQVFKREKDLVQKWFSDTLVSARPLRGSHYPRLSGLGFNNTLVLKQVVMHRKSRLIPIFKLLNEL